MKPIKQYAAYAQSRWYDDLGIIDNGSSFSLMAQDETMSESQTHDVERIYMRLREQVNAENVLYTQRIYWLIFIQAFLFATAGLVVQVLFDPDTPAASSHVLKLFLLVVAVLGIFVGIVCHFLFSGARQALREIGTLWAEVAKRTGDDTLFQRYPDVRGGVMKRETDRGNERHIPIFRSGNLGLAFSAAWITILCIGITYSL